MVYCEDILELELSRDKAPSVVHKLLLISSTLQFVLPTDD